MASSDASLLVAEGLSVRFGGVQALCSVDMEVGEGSIHSIIGPNGAGKTTLLGAIGGMVPPHEGRIVFAGQDISALPVHGRAALGILRTFQNLEIPHDMSVLDVVAVGAHSRFAVSFWQSLLATPASRRMESAIEEAALDALEFVGLGHHARRVASTLAFGQQRLVELARALAGAPRLLLLDEPAAGLNHVETQALAELIHRARARYKLTILLVEHDMDLVMQMSDMVTVLCFGKVIACGPPAQVRQDTQVIEAYLGESA